VLEITRSGLALASLRSRPACVVDGSSPTLPRPAAALAGLGENAPHYVDAYGAALCESDEPLALDMAAGELQTGVERLRPYLPPVLLVGFAAATLLLSPLAGPWAARRAQRSLPEVRPGQWQVIRSALGQLDQVTGILAEVRTFARTRSSVEITLADVARALPPGSVVTEFGLEDDRVQMSLLCPDGAALLSAVRRIPGATSVELAGPISHEATPAGDAQRVNVRFRIGARAP
jgi:hypothetical protein